MKRLLLISVFLLSFNSYAQNIKTDVLVVGGNAAGVAAAIQSARSGVKTLLIEQSASLGAGISPVKRSFEAGIWPEFLKGIRVLKKDSMAQPDPASTSAVLKAITDTVKNLTVRLKSSYQEIKKDGSGWEVKLSESKTNIKAKAVVDATLNETLSSAAGVFIDPKTRMHKTVLAPMLLTKPYAASSYRTSMGVGFDLKTGEPSLLPMGAILASGQENFFVIGKLAASQSSADAMFTGQATGANASCFAFFDESTKKLPLTMRTRDIQAELLKFGSLLVPYTDVKRSDPEFMIFQRIGLTGILKATQAGTELLFNPDSTVSSQEIRSSMKEYYSRSQIWFADKNIAKMTLSDMISLIKYTASRGNELDKELEKNWNSGALNLKGKFDLNKVLSRREFAVILDTYLKPFDVRVNLAGTLGS